MDSENFHSISDIFFYIRESPFPIVYFANGEFRFVNGGKKKNL